MRYWAVVLVFFALSIVPVYAQNIVKDILKGFEEKKESSEEIDALMEGFDDKPSTGMKDGSKSADNVDSLLEGFDDEATVEINVEKERGIDWLSFGGYMSLSESINYQHDKPAPGEADFRGLSRLRYKVLPELKIDLPNKWEIFASGNGFVDGAFYANGREQYRSSYLDEYEKELELRELWLQGSLGNSFDIKLGRQIVAWGKSDNIRVVDVLNPLDMREPGMVDIEDLRLPVTMARVDYYFGSWNLTAILIPEIRTNKNPVPGSDFYPLPFSFSDDAEPEDWKNYEYALALSNEFSGWDFSFHAASTFEDQFHVEQTDHGMQQAYSRINMIGFAENSVFGSWLLKMEYAIFDGLKYSNTGDKSFMRSDFMAGVDYSGITDHTISFEGLWSRIFDYDDSLKESPDEKSKDSGQLAIRYTGNFLHETVQIVALASIFGFDGGDGGFYRGSVKYILQDALSVTGGVMVYQGGDLLFLNAFAKNDRIFAEVRYDF